MDIPVSFPFNSGRTLPTAFAAPVDEGMIFSRIPRPPLQSFWKDRRRFLRSSGGVNGGHKTALNAERVVQYFCQGGKTVGRAGSVGNDVLTFVGFVVYAVYKHRGGVF